jgi:hypothetical protein
MPSCRGWELETASSEIAGDGAALVCADAEFSAMAAAPKKKAKSRAQDEGIMGLSGKSSL